MRKGSNPEKDKTIAEIGYHRIIIPIYIPNLEGYFEHGMEFTSLCLESVIKTKHSKALLTVVNNGSCSQITTYLQELYKSGGLDQLIHHKSNVGKIDAVIPVAKTASEALITISDGDVLFLDGWMQGVEEVFDHFPQAGMVSPVPHGTTFANHTTHTRFDAFFKRQLKFQSLCDPIDMLRFAESVGSDSMYHNKARLDHQLTVSKKGFSAVVGCGHFVSTLRREVFEHAPKELSRVAYAPRADKDYIDLPNEKAGLWRLATVKNYAYHMGNAPQPWMRDKFNALEGNNTKTRSIPKSKKWNIDFGVKKFVNRLLFNKITKKYTYRSMGLKEGAGEY